jgi:hypothetical protein
VSVDSEEKHFRSIFRRWFESRREFSHAEDLANGGVFFSGEAARAAWSIRAKQIDRRSLDSWRKNSLAPVLIKECNEGLSAQSLEDVFVHPEFERDIIYRKETDERMGARVEPVSFEQLLDDRANYLISATKETGKTTLLKQIALRIARREDSSTLPVLLNFGTFKAYKAQLETLIRQKLPQLPSGMTVQRLLSDGLLTILIDDVEFQSADRKLSMIQFITAYPKNRYILATSTAFVESAAIQPEISPDVPFIQLSARPPHQNTAPREVRHGVEASVVRSDRAQRNPPTSHRIRIMISTVPSTPPRPAPP